MNRIPHVWVVPFANSRLTYVQYLGLLYGFAYDETAVETAGQCGLSVRTVNGYYDKLRKFLLQMELPEEWAWDRDEDGDDFEDFHDNRRRYHPGWRRIAEEEHEAESAIRFGADRHDGSRAFFFMLWHMLEGEYRSHTNAQAGPRASAGLKSNQRPSKQARRRSKRIVFERI